MPSVRAFTENFPTSSIRAQILCVLEYATRAPSTHSSQPWRFSVVHNRLHITHDPMVHLPQSDRMGRYRHISMGYLLHHLFVVMAYARMRGDVHIAIDGTVEITNISKDEGFDDMVAPLFDALCTRRNRRDEFERTLSMPTNVLQDASRISSLFPPDLPKPEVVRAEGDSVERIAAQTAESMRRVYRSSAFRTEMASWITPTGSKKLTGLPGYSLNQPMILSWLMPLIIRFVNVGPLLAKLNYAAIASAPCVFGFGSTDQPRAWMGVGFQASHATLTLVAAGFDASIFVASIEHADTREEVQRAFNLMQPLQFLFAAGKLTGKQHGKRHVSP